MTLNAELGHALGMPPNCRKLVLTLEAGQVPRIEYECHVVESEQRTSIVDGSPYYIGVTRIRKLQFMVRLEPFPGE
jgi:hypothetical protein